MAALASPEGAEAIAMLLSKHPPMKTVVEFGVGSYASTIYLLRELSECIVIAVDNSPAVLAYGRSHFNRVQPIQHTLGKSPLQCPEGTIDATVGSEILCLLDDDALKLTLENCWSCLRSGGLIAFSVIDQGFAEIALKLSGGVLHEGEGTITKDDVIKGLRRLGVPEAEIQSTAEQAGLASLYMRTPESYCEYFKRAGFVELKVERFPAFDILGQSFSASVVSGIKQ